MNLNKGQVKGQGAWNKQPSAFFMMKRISLFLIILLSTTLIFSQEALKSLEEEYYDFMALQGLVERPTLGYRTLSDSVWNFVPQTEMMENDDGTFTKVNIAGQDSEKNVWKNNNLGTTWTLWNATEDGKGTNWFTRGFYNGLKAKVYGPEWFNSYNTAVPYGQNDGGLWQGRGYNSSLTGGIRFEGFGFEATFKPQISFSENREFELVNNEKYYTNKYAYIWGYSKNIGVDAPQRFGDKSFFNFDLGDTEIRWTWNSFTIGFGTEAIWLGPAQRNPILLSNNAPTFPKIDFGLRKTALYFPVTDWYLGSIEARLWVGKLTESDYFDTDPTNNYNQYTGMCFYYTLPVLTGLTIGINKIILSKWDDNEFYKYLNPLYGMKGASDGNVGEDQKITFIADWLAPKGMFDVYMELGFDDHINSKDSINSYITHYWHAFVYTFGAKKGFIINQKNNISGNIIFEWNNTEMSQDFQVNWPYNFGFHHQVTHGYTNKGQWLGSGIGYGGQSQYLELNVYYPKGKSLIYLTRYNPDNNMLFRESISTSPRGENTELHEKTWNYFKGIFAIGFDTEFFITDSFIFGGGLSYIKIVNPTYNLNPYIYQTIKSCNIKINFKYQL